MTDIETITDGESLRLHTSGGILDTHQKGRFGGFTVWYNPKCLANILSLALVSDQYRVTLDTEVTNAFTVHISAGHDMKFVRYSPGLYLYDASNVDMSKLRSSFSFLQTVSSNKSLFRSRDIRKADAAVSLNRRTNHVATRKFERVISKNLIINCPLTVGDVRRSHAIYGPPLPSLKGRTHYQESARVNVPSLIPLPREICGDLANVTLCCDFHFVNGVTVFHTISRRINYRTVSFPLSRSKASILHELNIVKQRYNARGFRIVEIHADNEFSKVENDILPIRLHCCGVDDHVPEVERSVRTQKNENRSVCHAMPYKCIPRVMVRQLILQGNEFLNAFGSEDNIGDGLTPRNIIDNLPHVDYNHLKYEFGEYVQLHISERITNTMRSRTIGALVLGPRNIRGRYTFMSLETGNIIDGRVVAQLPITDAVIARVEELGQEQNQPFRFSKMLKYEWRPGRTINDDDVFDDEDVQLLDDDVIPDPILPDLPDAGPNPFAPIPEADLPGAAAPDILEPAVVPVEEEQPVEIIADQGAQGAHTVDEEPPAIVAEPAAAQGAQEILDAPEPIHFQNEEEEKVFF